MDNSALFINREYEAEDKNFIYASFLRGLYYGNSWFNIIDKDIFMSNYHKILDWIFNQNDTQVKVCCLKEDKDVILGYCIYKYTPPGVVLHYVFVKKDWRKLGIAKSLLPKNIVTVTHLTETGKSMKPTNVSFNPFLT